MNRFIVIALMLVTICATTTTVFAQWPDYQLGRGEEYDPVADMDYDRLLARPIPVSRAYQQVLADQGYYKGPVDGYWSPEFRIAVWNFQRAKNLPRTAYLDPPTVAALETPAIPAASPQTR